MILLTSLFIVFLTFPDFESEPLLILIPFIIIFHAMIPYFELMLLADSTIKAESGCLGLSLNEQQQWVLSEEEEETLV